MLNVDLWANTIEQLKVARAYDRGRLPLLQASAASNTSTAARLRRDRAVRPQCRAAVGTADRASDLDRIAGRKAAPRTATSGERRTCCAPRSRDNGHSPAGRSIHMKGSPVDPDRIYASQTSGWFGQIIQRSDDGGKTWHSPASSAGPATWERRPPEDGGMPKGESNKFVYDTSPRPASRSPRTSGTTARSTRGSSSASGTSSRR
jgi:hypothetical protein